MSNLSDYRHLIPSNPTYEVAKLSYASTMYERLTHQIAEFESELLQDEEVGAYLASFGKEIIVQIEDISYHNPYLIIFYGRNVADESKVRLAQHVSQLNVLFIAVKVTDPNRKARRIGYILQEKDSSEVNE